LLAKKRKTERASKMLLVEPKVLRKEDIHKFMKQFDLVDEKAIIYMHELMDEYKKYQDREFRRELIKE
jgi:hypothetical protein